MPPLDEFIYLNRRGRPWFLDPIRIVKISKGIYQIKTSYGLMPGQFSIREDDETGKFWMIDRAGAETGPCSFEMATDR